MTLLLSGGSGSNVAHSDASLQKDSYFFSTNNLIKRFCNAKWILKQFSRKNHVSTHSIEEDYTTESHSLYSHAEQAKSSLALHEECFKNIPNDQHAEGKSNNPGNSPSNSPSNNSGNSHSTNSSKSKNTNNSNNKNNSIKLTFRNFFSSLKKNSHSHKIDSNAPKKPFYIENPLLLNDKNNKENFEFHLNNNKDLCIKGFLETPKKYPDSSPLVIPSSRGGPHYAFNKFHHDNEIKMYRMLHQKSMNSILDGSYILHKDFSSQYKITKLLGDGTFGFVLLGQRLIDHKSVAVKFILKSRLPPTSFIYDDDSNIGMILLEAFILKKLKHPNIISYIDYFDDGTLIYLVTEYFGVSWSLANPVLCPRKNIGLKEKKDLESTPFGNECGEFFDCKNNSGPHLANDLFECLEAHRYLPLSTVNYIFKQIYSAVCYIQASGFLHRDLKDENILIDENYNIKIIDFGSASFLPNNLFNSFNGTLQFASPEILKGFKYSGQAAEIWTLGILLFTLLFNSNPFPSVQSILEGKMEVPLFKHQIADLDSGQFKSIWELICKMLKYDPTQRLTLQQIKTQEWMTCEYSG